MKYYSVDTETHDPHLTDKGPSWIYREGKIICTGLYDLQSKKKKAIDGNGGAAIRNILFSSASTVIGANIGYDIGWWMYEFGITEDDVKCEMIDISVAESLIDENGLYSLDKLAQKYLGEHKKSSALELLATKHGLKGDFRKHLLALWEKGHKDEIRQYVIDDTDQPARIWECQKAILEKNELIPAFIMNMQVLKITIGMRQRGAPIDRPVWEKNCLIIQSAYEVLHKAFVEKYGDVNVNSGKQLADLFRQKGVPFKYKLVIKGWAKPAGEKFTKDDVFIGDEIWNQRKRIKQTFPNVRVIKKKLCVAVSEQYAARTEAQARNMGYQVTCNPSINKFTFAATMLAHPVVADIVELKQAKNIISKFLGPEFERFMVQDKNGVWRIHGLINPVGARTTGRMSSSVPNLQNIPSKSAMLTKFAVLPPELEAACGSIFTPAELNEDGSVAKEGGISLAKLCREVFIAEPGEILVKLDYNGQENRLQAHFAFGEEGKLIRKMYHDDPRMDEHQFVADRSGLQLQYGKKTGRKYAKNVRFGLSYGMQITTMCEQFGWDHDFAEELINAVKDASPWFSITMARIQDMLTGSGDYARPDMYGRTPYGKLPMRRFIKTLAKRRIRLRTGYDRDAYKFYNYLIQGSAADMIKMALVEIAKSKTVEKLILIVHDEAVFSVPPTPEGIARIIELQRLMEESVKLSVPVICDPEVGNNWWETEGQTIGKDADGNETGVFIDSIKDLVDKAVKTTKRVKTKIVDKTALLDDDEKVLAYVLDEIVTNSAIDEDDAEEDD